MKSFQLSLSVKAQQDLEKLHAYITRTSSEMRADSFINSILVEVEALALAPHRGSLRVERGKMIRSIGVLRNRVSIVFTLSDQVIVVLRVRYYGRLR